MRILWVLLPGGLGGRNGAYITAAASAATLTWGSVNQWPPSPANLSAASWILRSFFRSDKLVGTAHLKLERLETECEIREIVEVGPGVGKL